MHVQFNLNAKIVLAYNLKDLQPSLYPLYKDHMLTL